MAKLTTELINTFSLPRSEVLQQNAQDFIQSMAARFEPFKKFAANLEGCFQNRFIMFKQDVWYDFKTGLLLPKFDKAGCELCRVDDFIKRVDGKDFASFKMHFAGVEGHCISEDECRALFNANVNYPYRRQDQRRLIFNFGGEIAIENYLYTDRSWQSDPSGARRFFAVGDAHACWCSQKEDGSGRMIVDHAVLLPVFNLTAPHETVTVDSRVETITAIVDAGLIPEGCEPADFDKIKATYDELKNYISFGANGWQLDRDKLNTALMHQSEQLKPALSLQKVEELLLNCDKKRADLSPYSPNCLKDINAGHWELYEKKYFPDPDAVEIALPVELPARPPKADVKFNGICAIDFGTKSTVVACRSKGERLLRVGQGNFAEKAKAEHYENPTVIELIDLQKFQTAYRAREGRPATEWNQLTVSHQALNRLLNTQDQKISYSIFNELKQWSNRRGHVYRMRDQRGFDIELKPYDELGADDFDPIELYAYNLGNYINNMYTGIYLEYILSFPAEYRVEVRERVLKSFERGLKKSLPTSVLHDEECMRRFKVYRGANEPAAYASCALKELGKIDPSMRHTADRSIYFAVFDFGGGTTDFDYGIWRQPTKNDKGKFNHVIEHLDAKSDLGLGGERLLEMIAYEVYKSNLPKMRERKIPFALPEGCEPFDGAELLLTNSAAANLNRRLLSNQLRPIWEEHENYQQKFEKGLKIALFTDTEQANVELTVEVEALRGRIRDRIRQGVINFFIGLRHAFCDENIPACDILLAGNSCKSTLLKEIFNEEIQKEHERYREMIAQDTGVRKIVDVFRLHQPLSADASDENFERTPTGKTGVAFGLIDCRRGGNDVLIINREKNDAAKLESPFRYYIGYDDGMDCLHVAIGQDIGYNDWAYFNETVDDAFEIYYTDEPRALNNDVSIFDVSNCYCMINFKEGVEHEGSIYIRKVDPQTIEYVAATEDGLRRGEYLSEIARCELN